jgi:riboflavin biosynthesis pyrimidine reductase
MADILASMRRLFPQPADVISAREAYDVARPRPAERPWVGLCMVSSLDGSTVVEGTSRALGSPADTDVLVSLRRLADVIIVGASTARHEGYGPPSKPGQRIGVVSRTGNVDLDTPLFTSGAGFLILPEDAPASPVDSIRAGTTDVDLRAAISQLDADYVHAEGGPTLNAALAADDLIDELDLTVSPLLAGGDGPRLIHAAPDVRQRMQLAHVLEDAGFLFVRYVRPTT